MIFTQIIEDLQTTLKTDLAQILFTLKKNPALGYTKITQKGHEVGEKYGIRLVVNFPHEGKIEEYQMYGKRDLSLIIDQTKTRFPINRNIIKQKAKELIDDVKTVDAYMYENKEGLRLLFKNGRIDILPHSIHIWCEFTDEVIQLCDWLLETVYLLKS